MLARMRAVSAAAHGSDAHTRVEEDDAILYDYDLPGPGVAGGLLRLGRGVERIGGALRRVKDAREGEDGDGDEPMSLGDKVVVVFDVVVGVTNIVVGACDFVVGAYDFVEYARGALARFRGKASSGGGDANSKPCSVEGGSPISMETKNDVTWRGMRSDHRRPKRIRETGKYEVQIEDLPEDILRIIFSKLELKETVRTSVLSSKWTNTWRICPKLRFDGSKMRGKFVSEKNHTQKFIDNVNEVLKLQHGKVVEALEIKIEFDRILVDHLDNWVSFAASSWTKNLAIDLTPEKNQNHVGQYIFPFELFDAETMSRLQQMQLSFVSFKLPLQFSGFPKLRRLDLRLLHVSRKDLQVILSGCSNLEWLSIESCYLKDEIIVDRSLSHLLYLRVANCRMKKIELHATNLRTFIYQGLQQLTVDPIQAQELKVADIAFNCIITFEYALTWLPKVLTSVQNLTLRAPIRLKSPGLLENSSKFFRLKYLKLLLSYPSIEDLDNILSLASFLRAAPLIEELEIHFNIYGYENAEVGRLMSLPKCQYKYLRNICITGFIGIKGQAEFLVHAVENAPALEVLTIDTANKTGNRSSQNVELLSAYIARNCLKEKISPKTKFQILSG